MGGIRHVLLCPNPARPESLSVAREAEEQFHRIGISTAWSLPFPPKDPAFDAGRFRPLADEIRRAGAIVAFGGDGTILHLAPEAARHKVPVLGVNTGTLGFMSELEPHEIGMISTLADRDLRIEERAMLAVRIVRARHVRYAALALNDAVVAKGGDAKVVRLDATADGVPLGRFAGDGAIVATATGSTGYSMSAGGPILDPQAEAFVVTPICSHSAFNRPFVLPMDRAIRLSPADRDEKPMFLSVDGNPGIRVHPDDVVQIAKADCRLELIRLTDRTVYDAIKSKMAIAVG